MWKIGNQLSVFRSFSFLLSSFYQGYAACRQCFPQSLSARHILFINLCMQIPLGRFHQPHRINTVCNWFCFLKISAPESETAPPPAQYTLPAAAYHDKCIRDTPVSGTQCNTTSFLRSLCTRKCIRHIPHHTNQTPVRQPRCVHLFRHSFVIAVIFPQHCSFYSQS